LGDDRFVDVAHLQSLTQNCNAVFQVASNLNGIESKSELEKPTSKNYTKNYFMDRTQGPIASISAGAAAIVRVHAAYYNHDNQDWIQTETQYLNILQNMKEHFPTRNGYVIFDTNPPKFPSRNSPDYYKLLLAADVLYHKSAQVTSGHRIKQETTEMIEIVDSPKQKIDQVCCAAVNLAQGRTGNENKSSHNSEDKARFLLDLAYEGTYISSIKHNRSQIFLTLVGGGVFGNPIEWILDSLIDAHKKWGIYGASSLRKITLVLWSPENFSLCSNAFRNANINVIEEIENEII